jgi:hypothetical protein
MDDAANSKFLNSPVTRVSRLLSSSLASGVWEKAKAGQRHQNEEKEVMEKEERKYRNI